MNILLLCDYQPRIAATVRDHIEALESLSKNKYYRLSILGEIPKSIDLNRFDVVVIHYTLVACHERYLNQSSRVRLSAFKGLKAAFIQDEYRHVNATISAFNEIGIHLLFTCVPEQEIEKVYPQSKLPNVAKVNVLTGYVPENLFDLNTLSPSKRKLIVGYRGRKVPYALGDLGQEKYMIGIKFREDARRYKGLECDISFREEDRLYGDDWLNFLSNCRAVLGVESGASVFDFSGDIQKSIDAELRENPSVDYDTMKQKYFSELEGKISLAQISPRCFESAILRTIMVLYPGSYSERLEPWRHYIPLNKDHSNMNQVVEALRNDNLCDEIAENAFNEVALAEHNSYKHFVDLVDRMLEEVIQPEMFSKNILYSDLEFKKATLFNYKVLKHRISRSILTYMHFIFYRIILGRVSAENRDVIHQYLKSFYYKITFYEWRLARKNI